MSRLHVVGDGPASHVAEIAGLVVGPVEGGAPVVDGVEMQIHPGEVVALTGRSGSGKSTTALTLLGHLRPGLAQRSGIVRVAGQDPFRTPPAALRGRVVAYLGQDPGSALDPRRRIGDQIAQMVLRRSTPPSGRTGVRSEVERLVELVRLTEAEPLLRRYPHQISGGQAQRAAIAMALAGLPRLLVLDEPTSGLDPLLTASAVDAVRRVVAELDTAVLLITHDVHVAGALADRSIRMDAGRIVSSGPVGAVLADHLGAANGLDAAAATVPVLGEASAESDRRLEVAGLVASYRGRVAVDGLDLGLDAGRAVALVGGSGSGKTTTARCLLGLHRPDTGAVRLDGALLAPSARRRRRNEQRAIQLVAQDSVGALNPAETGLAAVARAAGQFRRLSDAEAAIEALELLEQVGIDHAVAGRRPANLSGGERQRVNLARALAVRPTVLVCDEPTASLDPATSTSILELLATWRDETGLSICLISHDLGVVARAAEQMLVLDAGRVVERGTTGALISRPEHPVTRTLIEACPAVAALRSTGAPSTTVHSAPALITSACPAPGPITQNRTAP